MGDEIGIVFKNLDFTCLILIRIRISNTDPDPFGDSNPDPPGSGFESPGIRIWGKMSCSGFDKEIGTVPDLTGFGL